MKSVADTLSSISKEMLKLAPDRNAWRTILQIVTKPHKRVDIIVRGAAARCSRHFSRSPVRDQDRVNAVSNA